ncbi:hypothetical protein ACGFX4_28475 [Kitasatospora sp. NPDC048365]|uniref:hypothetical protein n=1 Tax=Kitasatospora sp. NPDC048365 TaxID=3364050 RepID=UPI00370FCFFA
MVEAVVQAAQAVPGRPQLGDQPILVLAGDSLAGGDGVQAVGVRDAGREEGIDPRRLVGGELLGDAPASSARGRPRSRRGCAR